MTSATGEVAPRRRQKREVRLQQHRSIDVGDATLDCTLCGLGAPVVLLANAGCSTGYFDHLARALVTGGFQTISINMRGVGGSCGSLDGATLHDLAGDVAGVIKAIGCGPVHLIGHAFGNRIARCLAVDRPSLVRSVTLLAAGGLIAPPTPLGTSFRNATQAKMNGQRLRHHAGRALALASIRSQGTGTGRVLACGPYHAFRDQPERAPRILVERRHRPPSRDPRSR